MCQKNKENKKQPADCFKIVLSVVKFLKQFFIKAERKKAEIILNFMNYFLVKFAVIFKYLILQAAT